MSAARPTALARHRRLQSIWRNPGGWGRLSTVNHTVIGLRFMVTACVFFLIGGLLAMLIRVQLATPDNPFLDAEIYNQVFTMHGTLMMFLFAIPLIEGIALYLLPKLLGARDLSFPRLSAFGYWCYLFGGTMLLVSLALGVAPDGGWFMYTPLSSRAFTPGINADFWLLGVTFVEVSAICAAVEFTVTVLKVRTGGMSLDRMPLMAWYLLITAVMMLAGFPPLILGSILLEVERAFDWPFFDPTRGGSPLLWQHLFWLFGHPEVYIIFLPAAGALSTLIPVFARRPIVGYGWVVGAAIALAFLSFALWVHHMFTVGIPHLALAFFSAASMLVAVPTAVQVFAWLATLATGRPVWNVPMLYVFGFFFVFVVGGLTGVMVAVVPFNWQVHDTHFVVAHLHYVLFGGFVLPLMGAAYYWLPQIIGRLPVPGRGRMAFWLVFAGFNISFLVMHWTGLLGMPRRIYTYDAGLGWDLPNLVSSFGSFLIAIGIALFIIDLLLQVRYGRPFHRNPWRAGTLDWAIPVPPTVYTFASLPRVRSRDPLHDEPDLPARIAAGEGYLADSAESRMETLGVSMASGRPDQVILLPGPSYLPLLNAAGLGVFFTCFLLSYYWLSLLGLGCALGVSLVWLWSSGLRQDPPAQPIGYGETALPHPAVREAPGYWGMVFTLVADGVLFVSLVFGLLYLWVAAPDWPPPAFTPPGWPWPGLALAGLLLAAAGARLAVSAPRQASLGLSVLGSLLALLSVGLLAAHHAPDPTSHAYAATHMALLAYAGLHALLGLAGAVFVMARLRAGFVSGLRNLDPRLLWLWQGYSAVTGAIVLVLLPGLPWALG